MTCLTTTAFERTGAPSVYAPPISSHANIAVTHDKTKRGDAVLRALTFISSDFLGFHVGKATRFLMPSRFEQLFAQKPREFLTRHPRAIFLVSTAVTITSIAASIFLTTALTPQLGVIVSTILIPLAITSVIKFIPSFVAGVCYTDSFIAKGKLCEHRRTETKNPLKKISRHLEDNSRFFRAQACSREGYKAWMNDHVWKHVNARHSLLADGATSVACSTFKTATKSLLRLSITFSLNTGAALIAPLVI